LSEGRKYAAFLMMGMRCWKCHIEMGALSIPVDTNETPESIMEILNSKKIKPQCEECIRDNPMSVSAEQVLKEI
jgi:hypothetical protein